MIVAALLLLVISFFVLRRVRKRRAQGIPSGRAGKSVLVVLTLGLLAVGSALLSGGNSRS